MSGKLIMKRKLDKEQAPYQPQSNNSVMENCINLQDQCTGSNNFVSNKGELNNDLTVGSSNWNGIKRIRCDTPPTELLESNILPHFLGEVNHENHTNNQRNRQLLAAIQLKMLELQQELDEFEQDFGTYEEELYKGPPSGMKRTQMTEKEAEALGFAMCAQETMLFLQQEGVSPDSAMYKRLREALVGDKEIN